MIMHYEIEQYTICDGWINTWTIDDRPEIFDTYEEAQKELDDFFTEIKEQIETGEREPDNGYSREDFRIIQVYKK